MSEPAGTVIASELAHYRTKSIARPTLLGQDERAININGHDPCISATAAMTTA